LARERTLRARERHRFIIGLEQILTDFRANRFEKETEMRQKRIVAQDRMAGLDVVV